MDKEQAKKINEQLNGKTELQRAFDIFSHRSEDYQKRIDKHYKDIEFCKKEKEKSDAQIKKCLEKAKEFGIILKTTSKK